MGAGISMKKYLKDIFLLSFVIIIGVTLFFVLKVKKIEGSNAYIYYKNEVYAIVDFQKQKIEITTSIKEGYPKLTSKDEIVLLGDYKKGDQKTYVYIQADFELEKVRIRKDESPYQIAVNRGWYDGNGLPLVSAPNSISIIFKKSEVDSSV